MRFIAGIFSVLSMVLVLFGVQLYLSNVIVHPNYPSLASYADLYNYLMSIGLPSVLLGFAALVMVYLVIHTSINLVLDLPKEGVVIHLLLSPLFLFSGVVLAGFLMSASNLVFSTFNIHASSLLYGPLFYFVFAISYLPNKYKDQIEEDQPKPQENAFLKAIKNGD